MNNPKIKKRKYEKLFMKFSLFSAAVVSLYVPLFNDDVRYNLLWLLPASYFIFTGIGYKFFQKNSYDYGIVFTASVIVIFVRYVVMPFAIIFSSSYKGMGQGPSPSSNSFIYAFILMIIELFFSYVIIFLASSYFAKKQIKVNVKHSLKKKMGKNTSGKLPFMQNTTIILLFLVIMVPLITMIDFESLMVQAFPTPEGGNIENVELQFSGAITILSSTITVSILFLILARLKKKYDQKNQYSKIMIAWIVTFYYIGTLISTSRWNLIFSAILLIILLARFFPKTPKIVYAVFLSAIIVSFIVISIYKFRWTVMNSTNPYQDILKVMLSQFQEYFSGPRTVAQAIEMKGLYDNSIGMSTIVNDYLGSIPLLSDFSNPTDRINYYFNQYLGLDNNAQIIPLIGTGYLYFPFFPMIFTMLAQWIMMTLDYKTKAVKSIELAYTYAYIGLFFSMAMGFNTQILFGNFITKFIPLWILFKLNSKIVLKKNSLVDKPLSIL